MPRFTTTLPMLLLALGLSCPTLAHDNHPPLEQSGQPGDEQAAEQNEQQQNAQQDGEPLAAGTVDADAKQRRSPGAGQAPHSPATAYQEREILGWTIRFHDDLIADEELCQEVHDELHHQFFRITHLIPAPQLALLQDVEVWVELNNPYSNNCQYHPSEQWLVSNGFLAEKANGIELSNARGFLNSSRGHQPFVMLHELTHAYHDLHLDFNHAGILECYQNAREAGTYDSVMHINGRMTRAYAMTDQKEYFAESTEAYFGTNDHYPYVRSELRVHDPDMYNMVREAWGLE